MPHELRNQPLNVPGGSPVSDAARLEKAQAALTESEQRLRAMFDHAGVGIIELVKGNRIAAVNDRVCEILGYYREELLNRTVDELTYPDDRALSERLHGELQSGLRDRIDYEKRYLTREGSPVWVHVTASPVRDAGGRWLRSIATIADVTDRRKAEVALRASERRYRTFVDLTNQFAWVTNPKGEIVEDVPAFRAFTGQSHEQVKGTGWSQALHPEDLERTLEVWNRAVLTCSPYEIEYRMRRHDGAYRVLLVKGVPILDDERNVREWVGSCVDITERKAAEKALQESELFYRQTLESIPGMVFTTRPDGYCDYQSQQWVDFTGVPMSEHLGDGWNRLLHPDDRPRAFAVWRAAVGGEAEYDLEYRVRRHDGQYEWFKVRGRPIHDAQGRIVRWFGVAANIDVLKRTQTALQAATTSAEQAKEAAEEANRAKDQFLAVLSHELRTPLAPVLAAVQLMQRKDGLTEDARHHLEIIRRNVQLEARLIDDLLDLTRIVQGKISLERKPVYVCTAIERVAEICAPDIAARGLHFSVDIKERPHRVNGDISRLQQVLWNLLKNSIKFTPQGGCVGIRCYREQAHVIIEVNDSGIGIKPESISRIFNAFEQEDQRVTRQFGGLGLGLAIARCLVEMHDGTITAHSPGKDKGASFRVALPLFAAEAEPEAAAEGQKIPAVPKRVWSILLVEDHGDTAAMMRLVLEQSGYRVESADDVAQALRAAHLNHFDLLVSDLGLPDGSGLDLMKALRQRGSTLKGIALSGYGHEQDIRRSKEAGFSAHLTKPVDMDALIEAVAKAL
jgi:PAS domain S-box-containing protein